MKIDKILFPTDFSDVSYESISFVNKVVRKLESKLLLLHVVEYTPQSSFYEIVEESQDDILKMIRIKNEKKLRKMAEQFYGIEIERYVIQGDPFEEIIKFIDKEEVDLIILPTHGHTSLIHSLIGSVAEKIFRKAPCSVLTVKPKQLP